PGPTCRCRAARSTAPRPRRAPRRWHGRAGSRRGPAWSRPRQGDDEAGPGDAPVVVGAGGGDDLSAMRLADLLGDAEAEPGVGAELLARRALAVKAVEDGDELVGRNAGPLVRHDRSHHVAVAPHLDADLAAGRAEGQRVVDQVAEHLRQPGADPG